MPSRHVIRRSRIAIIRGLLPSNRITGITGASRDCWSSFHTSLVRARCPPYIRHRQCPWFFTTLAFWLRSSVVSVLNSLTTIMEALLPFLVILFLPPRFSGSACNLKTWWLCLCTAGSCRLGFLIWYCRLLLPIGILQSNVKWNLKFYEMWLI